MSRRSTLIARAGLALLALVLPAAVGCGQSAVDPPASGRMAPAPMTTPEHTNGTGVSDAGEAAATVLVSGMRFQPENVRIRVGQSVAWVFNDPGVIHSVAAFDRSFDSGLRSSGTFVARFDTPGTYCYQCMPHPGRNLCEQGARPTTRPLLLVANPVTEAAARLHLGGGGHMQGRIIVEE